MRSQNLIALVRDLAPAPVPKHLTVWTDGGWSAVVTPGPVRLRLGRRAALRVAATRQAWLEALLPMGTVIPALNGTRLTEAELPVLIAANGEALEAQAKALAGQVQYQITIRCDLASARHAMRHPVLSTAPDDTAWQGRFSALVSERLAALPGATYAALPVSTDIVSNGALLLPARAEGALDCALEDLDALWSDGLTIRQVGPSPAVSFASFGLTRITSRDLANAARLLDVEPGANSAEIREARQSALRRPAAKVDNIRAAATLLTQASALPEPGPMPQIRFWSEGRAHNAKAAVA